MLKKKSLILLRWFSLLIVLSMALSACAGIAPSDKGSDAEETEPAGAPVVETTDEPVETEVPTEVPATPTPTATPLSLGPDEFSSGVNPLTGLLVSDPNALNYPPALISITNFPASARPQSGISFASWVFEAYIGEGMTRWLALFYGEYPPVHTNLATLGDQIWADLDGDGIQDPLEPGYPNIEVQLMSGSGNLLATAVTNGNGIYQFPNLNGGTYFLVINPPEGVVFSPMDEGEDDNLDSDFDPETGRSDDFLFYYDTQDFSRDAGLIPPTLPAESTPTPSEPYATETPNPPTIITSQLSGVGDQSGEIGPIRSGRVWFEDVRSLFSGFIIMASAWSGVAQNLSNFSSTFGSDTGDINSAMIGVNQIQQIASDNESNLGDPSLSGNFFDAAIPGGCTAGESVWVRYSLLNQVLWRYNEAAGAYNRYQNDTVTGDVFTMDTDRINGEPLTFENVVILFADHHATAETYIDIDLRGVTRSALLFRNGCMYEVGWTTMNDEYEEETGRLRPIRFVDSNGDPFPLAPGQIWINIVPSFTDFYETVDSNNVLDRINQNTPGSSNWAVLFFPPAIE